MGSEGAQALTRPSMTDIKMTIETIWLESFDWTQDPCPLGEKLESLGL